MNRPSKILIPIAIILGVLIIGLATYAIGFFVASSIQEATTDSVVDDSDTLTDEDTKTGAPIYFATMTHMEGSWTDDRVEELFDRHVEQLRHALELAESYNAKITIESEQPFAKANTIWGVNVMKEIVDAGQGVGTHCDINPRDKDLDVKQLTFELKKRKKIVDDLVGAKNNRGCSGAGTVTDWAVAMQQAGFKYVDGVVGFHYLPMPLSARPTGWTDEYIYESTYHNAAPEDEDDRYHPFFVKDAKDFVADDGGKLLVSAGSVGTLQQLAEAKDEGVEYAACAPDCELTKEDVDALTARIRAIAADHDGSQIGKIDMHIQADDWKSENDIVLKYFFEEINKLVDDGVIIWATQGEVYDAVVEWGK